MNDDILKIKAALLYVVSAFEGVDILRTFKILYFANKEHLALYGRPIIKDEFYALQNGPVPSKIYDAVKLAQGKANAFQTDEIKELANSIIAGGEDDLNYVIYGKQAPDMDELSKSDVVCLNKSIAESKDLSFKQLSDKSHDYAWDKAWKLQPASKMDILDIARAAGVSDEMSAYIKEQSEIDAILS
ncbi:Panacea domain-containing protein [Geofilum rubicundum]|uniref:Antitoxin SocA-like Panacea domain-containing protein n=1 Tax=Geofilum rubicundum JCM 15548 TaxID=1236989 RepID=A0A0E9LTY4_9BACT|nr:Panacea domain-containing protein [Geofilum rubicundum]GAO28320.1 hypothetical protein JCM15548_1399 [Geofilum rubicundum JCM 15548]